MFNPKNLPFVKFLQEKITPRFVLLSERAFGVFGLGLSVWMVYRLGPERISANLHLINWGFFVLAALKGTEFVFEALAWKLITSRPDAKISFWQSFKTILEGNALNYITLTRMGGEPLKAIAFREKLGLARSAASAIVLKFCVLLGFWLVISGGFVLALFSTDLTLGIKFRIGVGIGLVTLFIASASWLQSIGFFIPFSWLLKKFESQTEWMQEHVLRLSSLDEEVFDTYRSGRFRISLSVILCALVWVEELFFIWLVLQFLHISESWATAAITGTIALLLNHLLFFIPWRAGTQEGTMVLSFTILGLSEPAGLSIAILKRLRELLWVFAGLIFFALETLKSPLRTGTTSR